jgi:hypothetical protein
MVIEGIECEDKSVETTGIKPGQMYMAKRNTGWHLLTCAKVHHLNYIISKEMHYPYDTWECFKVKE